MLRKTLSKRNEFVRQNPQRTVRLTQSQNGPQNFWIPASAGMTEAECVTSVINKDGRFFSNKQYGL